MFRPARGLPKRDASTDLVRSTITNLPPIAQFGPQTYFGLTDILLERIRNIKGYYIPEGGKDPSFSGQKSMVLSGGQVLKEGLKGLSLFSPAEKRKEKKGKLRGYITAL